MFTYVVKCFCWRLGVELVCEKHTIKNMFFLALKLKADIISSRTKHGALLKMEKMKMNKQRRDYIKDTVSVVAKRLAALETFKQVLDTSRDDLQGALDDESEYYENMPESLQNGEKGSAAQEAIDAIEEIINMAEGFVEQIEYFINGWEEIDISF